MEQGIPVDSHIGEREHPAVDSQRGMSSTTHPCDSHHAFPMGMVKDLCVRVGHFQGNVCIPGIPAGSSQLCFPGSKKNPAALSRAHAEFEPRATSLPTWEVTSLNATSFPDFHLVIVRRLLAARFLLLPAVPGLREGRKKKKNPRKPHGTRARKQIIPHLNKDPWSLQLSQQMSRSNKTPLMALNNPVGKAGENGSDSGLFAGDKCRAGSRGEAGSDWNLATESG